MSIARDSGFGRDTRDTRDPATVERSEARRVEVANALQIARPKLGDVSGVALYRLLRLVALEDIIGRGASGTAYIAGKKLGAGLGITQLDAFLELCKALRIGIIEVPVISESHIRIDVYECVTCSGLTPVGRTLCHFEGGLIAGVVESVIKKPVRANEVMCIGGLGDKSCSFDVIPR
ncbi:hypothetical protein L6R52_03060 [Myxococcota bacterium]|nr:hypothetical protein [Myxococcota bacterium]